MRSALEIFQTLFNDKESSALIEAAEEEWGHQSPFNSMAKLSIIVQKAKGVQGL